MLNQFKIYDNGKIGEKIDELEKSSKIEDMIREDLAREDCKNCEYISRLSHYYSQLKVAHTSDYDRLKSSVVLTRDSYNWEGLK